MRAKRVIKELSLAFAVVALAAGCRSVRVVQVAQDTPRPVCGDIKLYGTDNVPFEYQELGTVALVYDDTSQEDCLKDFVAEVKKLGGDAVLNFMLEPQMRSGGFMVVDYNYHRAIRVRGVAVKIKRP